MLPEIVEVAKKHNLVINPRTLHNEEVLCKCPFCQEDSKPGKNRKYYLSLNAQSQVFKCWFCGESGGVLRFIALLEGVPEEKVRAKYCRRRAHPAERLTRRQRLLMGGYEKEPDWEAMKNRDRAYYFRTMDHLWERWNEFLETERRDAYFLLILGIRFGKYREYVERIRQREKQIGASLLKETLKVYSSAVRPSWTEKVEAELDAFGMKTRKT